MRCYRILGETILSFFFIVPRRRINRVYLLPASRQLRFQNDVSHHYMNVYIPTYIIIFYQIYRVILIQHMTSKVPTQLIWL